MVEDQDDLRQMLVTALRGEGHQVDDVSGALEGLQRLREKRFDLVLSDYAMPGATGMWMLNEASRLGLMKDTTALIVTAHPDIHELAGVEVIGKPLDLDVFLEQINRIVGTPAGSREEQHERPGADASGRYRVELVLYVSSASTASLQACRNLERLLERFDATQIQFTICDLVRDPLAGEADRVAFTPTLVKRRPEPRMWVLGSLREPEIVADLLRVCGVDRRE